MRRIAVGFLAIVLAATPAEACTFCDGNLRTKLTLRMHFAQARAVLHGQLNTPLFYNPNDGGGFTDLHVSAVLKDDAARGGQAVVVLSTYFPVVGNTQRAIQPR